MNRRVLLLLLIIILIVVAVGAVLLMQGGLPGSTPSDVADGENGDSIAQVTQMATPEPQPTIPVVEVVIAIQDIPRGSRIIPDSVRRIEFLEPYAPFNAIQNEEAIIGQIARTAIFREQIITDNLIVPNLSEIANVGSDAAAILPTNRVAVAVPIDRIGSVAYAVQPGDRVDVIASFLFVDVETESQAMGPAPKHLISITQEEEVQGAEVEIQEFGIRGEFDSFLTSGLTIPYLDGMAEEQRPRLASQRTVQDALVIFVGDAPEDGRMFTAAPTPTPVEEAAPEEPADAAPVTDDGEPVATPEPARPSVVTLGVSPQDAVVLAWLTEARTPMTFALRSASSTSRVNTDPVTMGYIMSRFNILVPEKFSYALEPAITSLREVSAGNRVELQTRAASQVGIDTPNNQQDTQQQQQQGQ